MVPKSQRYRMYPLDIECIRSPGLKDSLPSQAPTDQRVYRLDMAAAQMSPPHKGSLECSRGSRCCRYVAKTCQQGKARTLPAWAVIQMSQVNMHFPTQSRLHTRSQRHMRCSRPRSSSPLATSSSACHPGTAAAPQSPPRSSSRPCTPHTPSGQRQPDTCPPHSLCTSWR